MFHDHDRTLRLVRTSGLFAVSVLFATTSLACGGALEEGEGDAPALLAQAAESSGLAASGEQEGPQPGQQDAKEQGKGEQEKEAEKGGEDPGKKVGTAGGNAGDKSGGNAGDKSGGEVVKGVQGGDGHVGHDHGAGDAGHDHAGHGHDEKVLDRYGAQVDPNAKLEIEFGTESHDFGTVRQGERISHTFAMASAGSSPLVIRSAKASCGCTVGHVKVEGEAGDMVDYAFGDPIAPGRKIEIEALIDTTSKSNRTQVKVTVHSNDPVSLTNLTLTANIQPFLTASPDTLLFGEVSEDATKETVVNIRTAGGEKVLLQIDQDRPVHIPVPPGLSVDLRPVGPDEQGRSGHWELVAALGGGLQEGPLGFQVALKSDKPMQGGKALPNGEIPTYTLNLPISGRVVGVLSVSPQYLSFGLVRPGQVVGRNVRVISHDADFQLDELSAHFDGYDGEEFPLKEHFSAILRPVPGQNALDIELRLEGLPENSEGSFKGRMMVQTGHPKKPEVQVVFSGVCRAGVARREPVTGNSVPGSRKVPERPIVRPAGQTPPAPVPAPAEGAGGDGGAEGHEGHDHDQAGGR